MSAQQTLLQTSLYAIIPATSLPNLLAHLSLLSIHIEPYFLHDTIYTATASVIPGQPRSVRLRSLHRRSPSRKGKGKAADEWEHSLVYVSHPLNGREYADISVRACLSVDVASMESRSEVEDFVQVLGMAKPYSYTQRGTLFHLPLSPTSTLHITVTQIESLSPSRPPAQPTADTDGAPVTAAPLRARIPDPRAAPDPTKPYVVEMKPGRPVGAVGTREQMSLQEVMEAMRNMSERIEGLEWSSGRD